MNSEKFRNIPKSKIGERSYGRTLAFEKNINLYDYTGTYELDTGKRNKRTTYWFGKEDEGGASITEDFYNKVKDYNDYRNIANQGMTPGITNNPLKKKRKSIFNQDKETIFGN
jgi:hypothetical protein